MSSFPWLPNDPQWMDVWTMRIFVSKGVSFGEATKAIVFCAQWRLLLQVVTVYSLFVHTSQRGTRRDAGQVIKQQRVAEEMGWFLPVPVLTENLGHETSLAHFCSTTRLFLRLSVSGLVPTRSNVTFQYVSDHLMTNQTSIVSWENSSLHW